MYLILLIAFVALNALLIYVLMCLQETTCAWFCQLRFNLGVAILRPKPRELFSRRVLAFCRHFLTSDLSIVVCGKSSQICCSALFSSEMVFGFDWSLWNAWSITHHTIMVVEWVESVCLSVCLSRYVYIYLSVRRWRCLYSTISRLSVSRWTRLICLTPVTLVLPLHASSRGPPTLKVATYARWSHNDDDDDDDDDDDW